MESRRVGHSGLRVSEVGLGSWLTLGSRIDPGETQRLIEVAFDLGIDFFDTANVYAQGAAEEALGRALRTFPRAHLVVATKCFFAVSERPNDRGLSRKHIFESVDASLRRLGTDYVDLHQCHRADPETPMEETVRAYEDLIRQGKVLYWGVSEWRAEQISRACHIADATGGYRPISNQPNYSIMRRGIEQEVLSVCRREGLGQLVFSPLGQGALTGKYADGARPEGSRATDPKRNLWMNAYLENDAVGRVERLRPLAEAEGLTLAQLALAWCLRHDGLSSVIIGASNAQQLEENVKASGRTLAPETLAAIDEIFPGPEPHPV